MSAPPGPILEVSGLSKRFGAVTAVDDVGFEVGRGETLALVGESGSGKTTVARLLVGLLRRDAGVVRVDGIDAPRRAHRGWRAIRHQVQVVFQDTGGALDPRLRVTASVAEPLRIARRDAVDDRVEGALRLVGLRPEHGARYPHQLSGGQRQRVGIARALALEPSILVLDEPVTALDVSVQAQIVNLLLELQERLGTTYVLIAHDLAVVRQVADRVAVMQAGRIVEAGEAESVYGDPRHEVTRSLLDAVPGARHRTGPSGGR